MSFNGSGVFVINTAGQPVVANTVISATVFNALTADLATGLSTCITKDGQTTVTANIPFGNNKITGLGAGAAATDASTLGQVQSTAAKLITVTGTDTISGTMSPALTAYAAGQLFYFIANGANTGAMTINIDGLGAKAITRDGSTALIAGDVTSGEIVVICYDGTRFQMINAANSFGNTTINGTLTVTGNTALQANVSITSALSVGGVFAVTGAATLGSTLAVTGNAGFQANVSITSALSVGGAFAVTGAVALGSTLSVAGKSDLAIVSTGSITAAVAAITTGNITTVNATTVDATNVEVTNIKAKDGTAAASIADSTGVVSITANPVLSGGTANGVLYLNGSKVATSGSALTYDGTTFTSGAHTLSGGNLTFSSTAQRITGDMSNATIANRLAFQNSVTNTQTAVVALPNGTSPQSQFMAFGASDGVNTNVGVLINTGSEVGIRSNITGTGTYLPMTFYTGGSERVRIDTSGNVGIGRSPSYRLDVEQTADAPTARIVANQSAFLSSNQAVLFIEVNNGTPSSTSSFSIIADYNGAEQFKVRNDGTIYAQNTTVQSISDVRVKESVRDAVEGLSVINALRPVRFDFKKGFGNNRKNQLGFIAQEVEAIFPDAVDVAGEKDDNGDPYKSVGPAALIPVLVKAIQQLTARVATLEAK